jgi:acetolactate synthase-1/2/3 large subunit
MKSSDLFVNCLEAEGVQYIFGVPGEENLDVLESLRNSPIKMITTRHEASAGFMAATIGRLTGKAGVCLSTLGPGATNLMTAAAYAQLGAMPMLMITGQKGIKKSKQGKFQVINTVEMMRPLTKFTKQVISGDLIASITREAIRLADEERPGAVHIELPEDIAAEPVTALPYQPQIVRRPIAEQKAIHTAVDMIKAARCPILLVAAGANRKRTAKMLRLFIEKTGIPFVDTQMGKGVIDERDPRWLGTTSLSANDLVHAALAEADLIINVGHDAIEKPPFIMKRDGAKVIHINFVSASIDDVYFPQHEVIGDIANTIWQLSETLEPQPDWNFSRCFAFRDRLFSHLKEKNDDSSFPLMPQRIVADVRSIMPSDGIICLDNGMHKLWFARQYQAHEPNTILLDNALATMGAGLPSAMAAKLLYPDRSILAICGDGGFMMSSMELETAVRLKLNLTILVLNDNGYGMIKWKQAGMNFQDFALDYGNPDFVKYAESFGAKGYRIEQATDLKKQLETCLNSKGVHLIEVPIDYSENARVFTKEIPTLAASV